MSYIRLKASKIYIIQNFRYTEAIPRFRKTPLHFKFELQNWGIHLVSLIRTYQQLCCIRLKASKIYIIQDFRYTKAIPRFRKTPLHFKFELQNWGIHLVSLIRTYEQMSYISLKASEIYIIQNFRYTKAIPRFQNAPFRF